MEIRTIKVLLVGDSGTGKSSLLLNYAESKFLPEGESKATVGVDFRSFRKSIDGSAFKICVWDTAGQERFRSMTKAFYRDADVALVVFDVGNAKSFNALSSWLDEIDAHCPTQVSKCLVANKTDLPDVLWQVTREAALELAKARGVSLREVSAKNSVGVQSLFDELSGIAANSPVLDHSSGNIQISEPQPQPCAC